jgi:hydroxyacylglutathione hydrolase
VHAYNPQTFILRENLCATFEAPFMYLLVGPARALLIDTGDVANPEQMPLEKTVMGLLPGDGPAKLPLLVVHSHRHLDHRAGDGQFQVVPNVQVVGYDLDSVKRYYKFTDWPNGLAHIDLGNRIVDALPTPGHNETHVAFYDENTGLFFSGDFLMPGRLLIDDTDADLASAKRAAAFVQNRPVTAVLGGHIEVNAAGETFTWESQYHPDEHVLQLTQDDLLALPAVVSSFNGFYTTSGTTSGKFIISQLHARPGRSGYRRRGCIARSHSGGGLLYSSPPACTEITRCVAPDQKSNGRSRISFQTIQYSLNVAAPCLA